MQCDQCCLVLSSAAPSPIPPPTIITPPPHHSLPLILCNSISVAGCCRAEFLTCCATITSPSHPSLPRHTRARAHTHTHTHTHTSTHTHTHTHTHTLTLTQLHSHQPTQPPLQAYRMSSPHQSLGAGNLATMPLTKREKQPPLPLLRYRTTSPMLLQPQLWVWRECASTR
jgi:hypothetical protein